ncbi:MAG: hypothetical protein ACP5IX_01080 [Patescibacteria group bacterium]
MTSGQVKILIFSLLVLLAGFFFCWQTINIFKVATIQIFNLIYFGISFLLFLIFLLLFYILSENRGAVYLTIFLLTLCFIFIYLWQMGIKSFNFYFLVLMFIFLILLIAAYELINLEKEDRLKLSLGRIWKRSLSLIIISLTLFICLIYYFHPLLKISQEKIELPPQLIKWLMKPMAGVFSKMLPFYNPEMTIDEMLAIGILTSDQKNLIQLLGPEILSKIPQEKLITGDFNELLKDPQIKALIEQQLIKESKNINQRLVTQERNEFARSLGIKLSGKETMDEVLSKLINSKLKEFIGPYYKYISLGIVVILFFLLKFIFDLVGLIAVIFAQLFFTILRAVKIVEIVKVTKEGEAIKL